MTSIKSKSQGKICSFFTTMPRSELETVHDMPLIPAPDLEPLTKKSILDDGLDPFSVT